MLIYNTISELNGNQLFIPLIFEVVSVVIGVSVWKLKISVKTLLMSIFIAIFLSLLSIIVVQGGYSGMPYRERFGWPLQYYYIMRGTEYGNPALPFDFSFVVSKYSVNTLYWIFIPIMLLMRTIDKKRTRAAWMYTTGCLLLFVCVTLFLSYRNSTLHESLRIYVPSTQINDQIAIDNDILLRKERAIESAYPELINFTTKKSFAGTTIKSTVEGNDYYLAYITNDSGVAIAEATCFRVDRLFKVYEVGEFPDPLDSFIGYRDIDPKNCNGIR